MGIDILVTSQEQLDRIATTVDEKIVVSFGTEEKPAIINKCYKTAVLVEEDCYAKAYNNALVMAGEDATVSAYGYAEVLAVDNSNVIAYDNAFVRAYDHAKVVLHDHAKAALNDNVEAVAYDNAIVSATKQAILKAYHKADVKALGNAEVEVYDNVLVHVSENASVTANDKAFVIAMGESILLANDECKVEAYENTKVIARDQVRLQANHNTEVIAYGECYIEAKDDSKVKAFENCFVDAHNQAKVRLYDGSNIMAYDNVAIIAESKTHIYINDNDVTVRFFNEDIFKYHKITMDTTGLNIDGYDGKWNAIYEKKVGDESFYLMEHETFKEEMANLVVASNGTLVVEDVWKGFDEVVMEEIKSYQNEKALGKNENEKAYENFLEKFSQDLKTYRYELRDVNIRIGDVETLSKDTYKGLMFKKEGSNCAVVQDILPFYEDFQLGTIKYNDMLRVISQKALESLVEQEQRQDIIDELQDISKSYDNVKDYLSIQLIPIKGNENKLQTVPHMEMEDLALICRVKLEEMSYVVQNKMLETYGIDKETLFQDAKINVEKKYPIKVRSIAEMLGMPEVECPMWVADADNACGASVIAYSNFAEEVGKHINEGFYIIPSSKQEIILIPESVEIEIDYLKEMITEVNRTEVAKQDKLSDNLYHYDMNEKVFELAESYEQRIKDVQQNQKDEVTVTYTVAECEEYHNLGKCYENIQTPKEALKLYEQIKEESTMNGIPAIGIQIHNKENESPYELQWDIVVGDEIMVDFLKYVPEITENPKALEAIQNLIKECPEMDVIGDINKWLPKEQKAEENKSFQEKLAKKKAEKKTNKKDKQRKANKKEHTKSM